MTPHLRRTALTGLALVLAVAGALVYAASEGDSVTAIWPPILVASFLPPALGAALHGRRAQRGACLLGAVVTGLLALVLFAYGYGICQIPAVVALGLAAAERS